MALISALQQAARPGSLTLEQAFGAEDITTAAMNTAIRAWFELYYARQPTKEQDPSQRIPYIVVNKLTRTAFSEYETIAKNTAVEGLLEALNDARKKAMQQALIGGEALLKPILGDGDVRFSIINRQNYLVFARNETGELTDIGTSELTVAGGYFYTLLERRTVDDNGYLTIQSRLYRSQSPNDLGAPVPLNTLLKYADLQPNVTLPVAIGSIGLIPIRTPMENCVDGSNDSVSVYEPAIGLIRLIAINEAQISGEFERGESRVIVSSDMMDVDESGNRDFRDHLFSGLPDGPQEVGVTIFSPAFREQSFLARKNEYLRNVESMLGLQRGLLADAEEAERTATEITSSKGGFAITITEIQQMWAEAVNEALRVCGILGKMYGFSVPAGPESASVSFGDGVLYDRDKVNQEMYSQVQAGLLAPEIYLGWYYEMPHDTPEARKKIRETYMPDIEELSKDGMTDDANA